MTKQQILNVLYPVRQAYREAIEDIQAFYSDDPYDYLYGISLEEGICYKIIRDFTIKTATHCIRELAKEKPPKFAVDSYWYSPPGYFRCFPKKIIPKCLQPRLDHLNRTITRLENEINEYT